MKKNALPPARAMNSRPVSILYVCTGNICRSPLAEALLKDHARRHDAAARLRVSSAGTHGLTGYPATPEAQEAGRRWGLDLSAHRAREITPAIAAAADIILAATQRHHDWLRRRFPEKKNAVYLALLFPHRLGAEPPDQTDIPDPIGESVEHYLAVLGMLQPTLSGVLAGALALAEAAVPTHDESQEDQDEIGAGG